MRERLTVSRVGGGTDEREKGEREEKAMEETKREEGGRGVR